jgi:glycerol-3-phosphate dehydrogenase (NAD(P)+)
MADAGSEVVMWARRQDVVDDLRAGRNERYLPGVRLNPHIGATTEAAEALAGASVVVLAVPSQTLRSNLAAWRGVVDADSVLVSLMKGVELGTTLRMSEVIAEVADVGPERVVVVSGPNLAREIAARQPAASVVSCVDVEVAQAVAAACAAPYFRPYTNTDVIGTELGGATKNVVALCTGMAEGMGMGDNSKASIITRGLAETVRLGVALGAHPETFLGLAGVGDLVATCMSPLSRNRTFGVHLGQGMSVDEVVAVTRQTAEGVTSCESIQALAHAHGVEMPIVDQVVAVVRDRRTPQEVFGQLMSRARTSERS